MKKKHWISALAVGVALGLIVASVMTFLDWRLNPSGIFHNDRGTNWAFVMDTFVSWFFPVAAYAGVVAAAALFLYSRFKK